MQKRYPSPSAVVAPRHGTAIAKSNASEPNTMIVVFLTETQSVALTTGYRLPELEDAAAAAGESSMLFIAVIGNNANDPVFKVLEDDEYAGPDVVNAAAQKYGLNSLRVNAEKFPTFEAAAHRIHQVVMAHGCTIVELRASDAMIHLTDLGTIHAWVAQKINKKYDTVSVTTHDHTSTR